MPQPPPSTRVVAIGRRVSSSPVLRRDETLEDQPVARRLDLPVGHDDEEFCSARDTTLPPDEGAAATRSRQGAPAVEPADVERQVAEEQILKASGLRRPRPSGRLAIPGDRHGIDVAGCPTPGTRTVEGLDDDRVEFVDAVGDDLGCGYLPGIRRTGNQGSSPTTTRTSSRSFRCRSGTSVPGIG